MTETNFPPLTDDGGAQNRSAQIDADMTEKTLFMAGAIGSSGFLYRYVPAQPRWCRTLGDQIAVALRRHQDVHPFDLERVAYVFNKAQAQHNAKITNRKPRQGSALLFTRVVDEFGIPHWGCEDVPLWKVIVPPAAGCA